MTWRTPLPARPRFPNSADTTPAYAGCRATTTAATPGSASVFKPSSTAGAHPTMTLSHAESARHIAQTPVFCSLSVARDGSLGLADQHGEASLALDQRQVAQVSSPSCSIRSKAYSTASLPRRRFRSARKSGVPSSWAITASPSIRNDCLAPKPADGDGVAVWLLIRVAQLDQRTALPDQCLHSAEADVRPARRKSGFDPDRKSR